MAILVSVALVTTAHVGSPDVYFEGVAGPYGLRVIVRTPDVVPGQAEITVRATSGGPITTVAVVPAYFNIGLRGAPPPDTARLIAPNTYVTQVWLMRAGSYSLHITVDGAAGKGTVLVPIVAFAMRRLELQRPMAIGLVGLGLFLLIGAITIIRAAVGESELPPGQAPNALDKTYGWVAAGASGVLLILAVVGGRVWWNSEDASYRRSIYHPWTSAAAVSAAHGTPTLTFSVTDSIWPHHAPLLPDHGKLMHLFLVRLDGSGTFVHLHPRQADSNTFVSALPAIPAGHYRAFADLVTENGISRTLSADVDAPTSDPRHWTPSDPDDAAWIAMAGGTPGDTIVSLSDGLTMSWTRPATIAAGNDLDLRVTVRDAKGQTVALEPYMGMAAHAVVARDDGTVFIHLHPNGTFSMAAQQALTLRQPDDSVGAVARRVAAVPAHAMAMTSAGTFSFPYAFPQPGDYHVWVQVKHGGKILTGAFPAAVH